MTRICYNDLPLKIKQVLYDGARRKVFSSKIIYGLQGILLNKITINNEKTDLSKLILDHKIWLKIIADYNLMKQEEAGMELFPYIFGEEE